MNKRRILVADDDKETVELIRMVLETKDYEIIPAYDGEEALAKAREEKPDLIILDILLPKVNGFRICRILKGEPECKSIPILILTAVTEESMRNDEYWRKRSGADDYITKPFEIMDLLERVDRLLKRPERGTASS